MINEENIVRKNGSIDKKATLAALTAALDTLIDEEGQEGEVFANAVNAVFDANPGVPLTMPALEAYTLGHLNVPSTQFSAKSERLRKYIQANSQGKKGEEHTGSLFVITKGKQGGVRRRADLTPEANS